MNHHPGASSSNQQSLPEPARAAVDRQCDAFARQSQMGPPPRIEGYLAGLPDEAKSFGFRRLLALELEWKVNAGRPLDANDYIRRFPQYHELVEAEITRFGREFSPSGK